MELIVPYTVKFNEQVRHLNADGWSANYFYVGNSQEDYFNLLNSYWDKKQGFILVEHDIIPWPGALNTFLNCPEPWCGFQYLYPPPKGYKILANGCTKFSKTLIDAVPDLFDIIEKDAGLFFDPIEVPKGWTTLDGRMNAILRSFDFEPHVHMPPVVHLLV